MQITGIRLNSYNAISKQTVSFARNTQPKENTPAKKSEKLSSTISNFILATIAAAGLIALIEAVKPAIKDNKNKEIAIPVKVLEEEINKQTSKALRELDTNKNDTIEYNEAIQSSPGLVGKQSLRKLMKDIKESK